MNSTGETDQVLMVLEFGLPVVPEEHLYPCPSHVYFVSKE